MGELLRERGTLNLYKSQSPAQRAIFISIAFLVFLLPFCLILSSRIAYPSVPMLAGYTDKLLMALTLGASATAAVSVNGTSNSTSNSNSSQPNGISSSVMIEYLESPPPPSELNQTNQYIQPDDEVDFYDADSWTLWTNKARNNTFSIQPYSANGYIGVRIPVQGQGFAVDQNYSDPNGAQPVNGWPLLDERFTGAYVAGFWDTQKNTTQTNFPELLKRGGESIISTLPQWTTLELRDQQSKTIYSPDNGTTGITSYYQGLSLKNGLVQTNVTWEPHGSNVSYKLNYTVVTHRTRPNLGIVRLDITPSANTQVDISDILDGAGSLRTEFVDKDMDFGPSIWTAVRPHWLTNVTGYEFSSLWFSDNSAVNLRNRSQSDWASSNQSTISQQLSAKLKGNTTFTVIKYVGVTSTDAYTTNAFIAAKDASDKAVKDGWDTLFAEHSKGWAALWDEADVQIASDEELQISIRATIFHLLSNVRDGSEHHGFNDNSISVGGLSSDSYGGLIFWDADLWMEPGLSVLFPNHAASINNYRTRTRSQAILNAKSYNDTGALYPWTSGRWGNCTGTGPCVDYEYHLNFDIALSQWNYYQQTGDKDWLNSTGYPIIRDAAEFFASYVTKNGSFYETRNLTDPDEYANQVNNGAYTNGGISQLMKWALRASEILGLPQNSKWLDVSNNMKIPENATLDLTLEFDGMNGTAPIKQADVVLLQYPLEFPQTKNRAQVNLDYYANHQSPDGPAMTYAIFAIDKAQLNTVGCSTYTYLAFANQPYLRRPYYQFSEQLDDNANTNGGTHPAFPFLTGHGGYLQVYTHGLTGYRAREDRVYLDPSLPPQLGEGVVVKGMKYQGAVIDVNITLTNTTVTRRADVDFSLINGTYTPKNQSGALKIEVGERNPLAGNYTLHVNESISFPTFRPDEHQLLDGNIAECMPVDSLAPWVAGSFPFSINDGDNSTFWQPLYDSKTAITLDLGTPQRFSSAYFLWGSQPPKKVSLGIPQGYHGSNVTSAVEVSDVHWLLNNQDITLSAPYVNGTNTSEIVIQPGNDSSYQFNSTYESRFVQIAIEGSWLNDTQGGRVAEFALF